MTVLRPKDEPWPGGRGVYDWHLGAYVPVLAIESAGVALDRFAHATIWPRKGGSSAEACAMYGGASRETTTKEK